MSFADHHNLEEVEKFSVFSDGALKVINAIKNEFNKTNLSVGIGRQLELALDVSEDNLTLAILYLALGTRAIARGLDHRLFKDAQQKTKNKIPESFRNVVRAFGYGEEGEDPQGDTYHFWHGVVAGLSREEEADPFLIREIKGRCLDWIYTNSANTVSFFRDRLILKRKLDNHRTVDLLGYSVGRAIAHSNSLS